MSKNELKVDKDEKIDFPERGKWYDEHINVSINNDKIQELVDKISEVFNKRISHLENQIIDLKNQLMNKKDIDIREQNMLIRQNIPIPFIANHTNSFTEIRNSIMNKSKTISNNSLASGGLNNNSQASGGLTNKI